MWHPMIVRSLCIVAAVAWMLPTDAQAQPSDKQLVVENVQLGFNGRFKLGAWTPVFVKLRGNSSSSDRRLTVQAPDGDGVPVGYLTPAITSPASELSAACQGYLQIGRSGEPIQLFIANHGYEAEQGRGDTAGSGERQLLHTLTSTDL